MPTLDELEIQITADAKAVNTSINSLAKKLETLSTSLKKVEGVNLTSFSSSLKGISSAVGAMKGVSAKKFEDLAKGFNTLSAVKIDASEFNRMSSALSKLGNSAKGIGEINSSVVKFVDATARLASAGQNMAIVSGVMPRFTTNLQSTLATMSQAPTVANGTIAFTQALGQLANAGAKLNVTTANLGKFGAELLNTIKVLSKAPQVSANTIQMTNALANLGSQGSKVATATRKLSAGLNTTHTAMQRTSKSTWSLAAAFGKFYASYFLVIRAFKGIGNAIKSTMDYIETANYFNEAFNQVAQNADLSAYERLGYESAEVYAKSFSERAKELTAKMTGYAVGESGSLIPTGAVSLGMSVSELMNYQAMFGQMASSMGVASETSLKLSNALTMIGADLASIKNMEFEDTWQNMASGIVGMSRSWDRYGVNIRNVNLQQKLNELGIQASIDKLNQQDKALLRGIILLDNTRYAWADLSDTINQPANQLRLLEASTKNFARTFGGLFIGLVSEALPYVNGLMIAFERMVRYAGDLFGVDWDASFSAMKSTGENTIISDILDQTEEAQSKLKTLKRQLMGFDEINKLGGANDSATSNMLDDLSGITTAFDKIYEEYTAHWEEQFKKVENNANKIADKIEKAFEPIKKILASFSVGNFLQAGEDTSTFVVSLFNFFSNAIDNVDWYAIGGMVGDYLAGIDWGSVIKSGLKLTFNIGEAIGEVWLGNFNKAPIETALLTALGTLAFTGLGAKLAGTLYAEIVPAIANKLSTATFMGQGMSMGTTIMAGITSAILGWNIGQTLYEKVTGDIIDMNFGEQMIYLFETIFTGELWEPLFKSFTAGGLVGLLNFEAYSDKIDGFKKKFVKAFESLPDEFGIIANAIKDKLDDFTIFDNYKGGIDGLKNDFINAFKEFPGKMLGVFSQDGGFGKGLLFVFVDTFNKIKEAISGKWNEILGIFNKGGTIFNGFVDGVANVFKEIVNKLIDGINSVIAFPFNRINTMLNSIRDTRILGMKPFEGLWGYNPISVPTIPKFATGGFPEDGLFMANHNELVGKFSNGRTAVANNEQIISGIERGVYNAVTAALSNSNGNTNVTVVLQGDADGIFEVVQERADNYARRYNKPAFG